MGNDSSTNNGGFYTPKQTSTPYNFNDICDSNEDQVPTLNNDLSDMLTEIASEIDGEYVSNDNSLDFNDDDDDEPIPNDTDDQKHKFSHISLSFVAKENYLHKIDSIFTYSKQLGFGASCRVLLVKENKSDIKYALKEMKISDDINRLLFATEYKILNILSSHKNIISYHSSYIDKNCYYLSTSYCSGGTMLDRIINQGNFNEFQCADFIKNVLYGIQYMHHNKIVHRDIKCENLIFDKEGKDGIVKIIDFGNSEIIKNAKQIDKLICGSLHYLPPEMLSAQIRTKEMLYKGDMWAVGVVCYILVSGKVPFYGNNQSETLESIKNGKFKWPNDIILSDSCKNFISSLLCCDINKRLNSDLALKHEWISKKGKALNINFGDQHLNQIQLFSTANKLQKILINAILSEMDKTEKKILLKALRDLDINGNGKINENDIINYVLINGKIEDEQNAKYTAKKFMSHVKQLSFYGICSEETEKNKDIKKSKISHISLNEIDIEGILDEIDELDAMEINHNIENDEKSESKQQEIPTTGLSEKGSKSAQSVGIRSSFDMIMDEDTDSDDDDDDDDDNKDEDDDKFDIDAMEQQKLKFYYNNNNDDDDDENINDNNNNNDILYELPINAMRTISVDRFAKIMNRADKEYDIKSLVNRLRPTDSGNIPLQNINMFNGALHSKQSNNVMMYDMVQIGLNTKNIPSNNKNNINGTPEINSDEEYEYQFVDDDYDDDDDDDNIVMIQ